MTTHAEYLCCRCDITLKLRGYQVDQPITCPQCSDPMIMDRAEISYDYDSGHFLGESRHFRPYSHRTYTPAFPSAALLKPMLTEAEIKDLVQKSITDRLGAIDKTATNARMTAESLRQSVVDQQSILDRAKFDLSRLKEARSTDTKAITQQAATIQRLVDETRIFDGTFRKLSGQIADAATALEATDKRLRQTRRTVKKLDMSYVEEESAKTTTAADPAPAAGGPSLADAGKKMLGVMAQGSVLGLTTQFVAEGTDLLIKRGLAAGMISKSLAESDIFKEAVQMLVPMMLFMASQYPAMPKREFLGKASEVALSGQTAKHSAAIMGFGMAMLGDMLALPSAQRLEGHLNAAE